MTSRGWWWVIRCNKKAGTRGTPRREPAFTIRPSCGLLVRGLDGCDLLLLLGDALGDERVVLGLLLLLVLDLAGLDGVQVAAALETLGRDEALDFGAIVINQYTSISSK